MEFSFDQPGIHETPLREHFSDFEVPEDARPWPGPVCIVVFVNRSGSSMICERMRATDKFTGFGEPLNFPLVIERATTHGIETFTDYFRWLHDNVYRDGTMFGLKASCDQVIMLLRSGVIPRLFQSVRWVTVQREDILSQAVSLSIADQTKRWHSFQEGIRSEANYDFDDIQSRVYEIAGAYSSISALMSLLGEVPYRIIYEEFVANVDQGTRDLAAYLGEEGVTIDHSRLRMQKQRNSRNAEFRQRFLAEFYQRHHLQPVRG